MIHTTFAIVWLVARNWVPWWRSTALTLVRRIGARCIWLLVGTQPRDVSWLTTSKASDLSRVVVVVVVVVIGVVVSWPGIGILLRLVAWTSCRRSSLLRLIGWFG